MKVAMLIVPFFLLSAAGVASAQAPVQLESVDYPLKVGQRWTYQVTDLKKLPAKADPKNKVEIEVEKEEIYTRKEAGKNDEKFIGFTLKSTSGANTKRDQIVVLKNGVYRVHTADVPLTPPLQFFKQPLGPGESWEVNSMSGKEVIKGTFTRRDEKITVPHGAYEAMAIRFRSDPSLDPPYEFTNWFVRGIGMVKQHVKSKDHERLLELQSFSGGK